MSRDPALRLEDNIAHSYFRTEDSIIWDAATIHTPMLISAAHELLNHL